MIRRTHMMLLILLAFVGGLGGGIASRGIGISVFAQTRPDLIEAREFRLVSETGETLGVLKSGPTSGTIVLFNRAGQIVWTAPEPAIRPLATQ